LAHSLVLESFGLTAPHHISGYKLPARIHPNIPTRSRKTSNFKDGDLY
jgi:hypothetical protein